MNVLHSDEVIPSIYFETDMEKYKDFGSKLYSFLLQSKLLPRRPKDNNRGSRKHSVAVANIFTEVQIRNIMFWSILFVDSRPREGLEIFKQLKSFYGTKKFLKFVSMEKSTTAQSNNVSFGCLNGSLRVL